MNMHRHAARSRSIHQHHQIDSASCDYAQDDTLRSAWNDRVAA